MRVFACVRIHGITYIRTRTHLVQVTTSRAEEERLICADRDTINSEFGHREWALGVEAITASDDGITLGPYYYVGSAVMERGGGARDSKSSNGVKFVTR